MRSRRIKGQRNETLKALRFVLLFEKPNKMIYTVLDGFDVAVEHRGICFQAGGVHFARKVEPALSIAFMGANHRAGRLAKDFGATARARVHPGLNKSLNNILVRHPVKMGKMINLNHRKSFQMEPWMLLLQR